MKFKVELDDDAVDDVIVQAMKYWRKKENHYFGNYDDKKDAKRVMKAAKVMLDWYGG